MIVTVDKTGRISEFAQLIETVARDPRVKSILVLACDENDWTPEAVAAVTRQHQKPIFGGLFPGIIAGQEKFQRGTIVAGLFDEADIQVIPGLSDISVDYETLIDDKHSQYDYQTFFVFVDGLSTRITTFIDSLFNIFGLEFNYIGGGAGSLKFRQKPCLLTNEGLHQDCAVLAKVKVKSGIGVCHGWIDVEGPYKVTESNLNMIRTLDWKPAFEVYREIVARHSEREVNRENFFEIAKSYPFGITKLGAENIVRDLLKVEEDGVLVCIGEVPQESYVHILTGDANSLVTAAATARMRGESSYPGREESKGILFIDCISRMLFLGEEYFREIAAVHMEDHPLIGALTLGEIANNGNDYLEFYNKTSVVGVLEG